MRVLVTVAVHPPVDHPPLDELRRHGAAAVINNVVGRAVDATGRNGELITVVRSRVAAHPTGVEIGVLIETRDRSAPVGDLVTDLVAHIVAAAPALTSWTVGTVTCEEQAARARSGQAHRSHVRPGRR